MTGNMAPKTGNSRLRNHQHQTEKEEKSDSDNPILNSRSLLHLAVPAASNKISSIIFKHFLLFSSEHFLIVVLFKNIPWKASK